ncbi:MAG: 30S ribosomal protein S6 [Rhodospirillaceae bacterium]|nr:30S ribosomal protein S6 [Rhodospirillaceae bacterium]|tara:strand:- start:394 stop:807 length:414 start_codon:yes stop_codon:yes gene_type:complete
MALYEHIFIVRQDTPHQRVEELTKEFSEIISKNGGEVKKTEFWGLRSLAYKIKKNKKGHYILMNIDAPSSALKEMENSMLLNEDVIRSLSIKVNKHEEGPSIMMKSKDDKEVKINLSNNSDGDYSNQYSNNLNNMDI